jgi:hypothetical protein
MSIGISNTSPLLAFSAIGRLALLRNVFGRVVIPPAVRDELFPVKGVWHQARDVRDALLEGAWLQVAPPPKHQQLGGLRETLGAGEAEAIALALLRGAPLVIDDLKARETGRALGLEIVGTLGIVARNKRMRAITEAEPIVRAMQHAGIYYSDSLISRFLIEMGERK